MPEVLPYPSYTSNLGILEQVKITLGQGLSKLVPPPPTPKQLFAKIARKQPLRLVD